jgi:Leucine-rich repeat (LRR) protein
VVVRHVTCVCVCVCVCLWQKFPLDVISATLQHLDLSGNAIVELPHEIGHLTALKSLNLNGNKIQVLIPEIGNLQSLEKLTISNNDISVVARNIGRLTRLEDLNLDGNPNFSSVLADFGECRHLIAMNLSNCALRVSLVACARVDDDVCCRNCPNKCASARR